MAQFVESHTMHQEVDGSILEKSTCLGFRLNSQWGHAGGNKWMFLSPSLNQRIIIILKRPLFSHLLEFDIVSSSLDELGFFLWHFLPPEFEVSLYSHFASAFTRWFPVITGLGPIFSLDVKLQTVYAI